LEEIFFLGLGDMAEKSCPLFDKAHHFGWPLVATGGHWMPRNSFDQ